MADNVSITQGSGTTIATEDVSGIQHQKVKIEFGGDGVATMVSASDPLPVSATIDTTGLATDATDTSTASIDSKTPALGQALAAASVPVVLTAAQITTLTPPAAITGFATSAKQDTIIGHVDGIEGLLTTIDGDTGTIATEVAGLLTDTELRATPVPVSGTVTANLGATDNAVLDDIAADTEAIKTSLAGTLTVTGGGGGVEYTEGDTDASITGSAIMWEDTGDTLRAVSAAKPLPISDAGGAITVDGTVAVTNAGITTIAGAVSGTEMQVDVLTMPTVAVTQSGAWDEVGINDSGNSITIDNAQLSVVGTGTEATAMRVTIATDSTGVLSVDDNGGALTVDGTVAVTNADITTIAGAVSGTEMQVDVLTMPTVTVTATNLDVQSGGADLATSAQGAAIQTAVETIDNAIAGSEMQVDVVTVPTDPFGANADAVSISGSISAKLRALAGTAHVGDTPLISTVATGGQFDDVSPSTVTENQVRAFRMSSRREQYVQLRDAAGNERGLNIGASGDASVTVVSALPAGTNAIGKLAANSGVDIGDVTLTAGTAAIGTTLPPDIDVTTHTNYARKYYTNAGAVTDGIVWSPAAGKRWHVVTMYIQTSAAATITLEDDKAGGDDPVWKGEIAANSGVTLSFTEHYPMASGEDAADLIVTTSAGNIYITAVGYEI